MKKVLFLTVFMTSILSGDLFAAADTPVRGENTSESEGSIGGILHASQSDGALARPHEGRGGDLRRSVSEPAPSIYNHREPHGFDIDQVVINQHEGRQKGKGRMAETFVTAHISNKGQVEASKRRTAALRNALQVEEYFVQERRAASKQRKQEIDKELVHTRAIISDLKKTEQVDSMRAQNEGQLIGTTHDALKKNMSHLTDDQIHALPSHLPKYEDAKARKAMQQQRGE